MGNYRFRLSDMMPNAWFYKLRDMSKPSRSHHHHHSTIKKQLPTTAAKPTTTTSKSPKPSELKQPPNPPRPRKSYYFTRDLNLVPVDDVVGKSYSPAADFPDPPRKSAKQRTRRRNPRTSPKRVTSSAVSAGCRCRIDSVWTKSDSPPEFSSSPLDTSPDKNSGDEPPAGSFDGMVSNCCGSCRCRVNSVETQIEKLGFDLDSVSDLHHLPPIITKPAGFNDMVNDIRKRDEPKKSKSNQNPLSVKIVKEQSIAGGDQKPNIPARKNSPGVRLRTHSPKIGSKKVGRRSVSSTTSSSSSAARRSISDSCAVVKSSFDPQRDFKESMMEMIVENNLRASKDLEDLLACYLSLNSDEYHELIIGVFKQIWFDLSDLKFK